MAKKPYEDIRRPLKEDLPRGAASKATKKDSMRAGQYLRWSFAWTPSQLEMISQIAEEMGLSKNATARWLMDEGLLAFVDGRRPGKVKEVVRTDVEYVDWSER